MIIPARWTRGKSAVAKLETRKNFQTVGRYHDLDSIFSSLNTEYFGGEILADIYWGATLPKPRRQHRVMRMGACGVEDQTIHIHRGLDLPWVPPFFVRYVVFHEMLHLKHPPLEVNGRRSFHHPGFMAAEKAYPDYQRAARWEKENIDRLLWF